MTAITTAAHIDAQTQEDLMRQAGIWIEHSTLIEDDLPARPLAAVQAEKHQLDRYTQLVAARAAEHAPQCLAQIEEPATLAGTTIEQYARMFDAACEALGQVSDCLGINSDINPGAEPIIAAIEQLRAGKTHPVLDDRWKARMLDGRAPERDEMGFGNHPELPMLDEGMMPRSFFAALGLELAHTSAEDQLDWDVLGAMSEAVNWTDWLPTPPHGDGWKLVSIFDTEDGPVAWWLRELPEAEDGTTTIRNLQAEVEKLEARIARISRAGAAPAAEAPQGVVAWMHPETLNVISAAHKHDMSTEYGAETRRKAESYSVALVRAGEPAAAAPALEAPAAHERQTLARDEIAAWAAETLEEVDYPVLCKTAPCAFELLNLLEAFARDHGITAAAPQAPAAPVHSKTYSDGTVATGSGELPAQSPQQQVLCTLLDTVEAMLGGANGPTIQIRAALLAAPAAPAEDACPLLAPETELDAVVRDAEQIIRDAEHYRFIKRHRLILSGGTDTFGWPIAPFGDECDRYIAQELATERAAQAKEGGDQ